MNQIECIQADITKARVDAIVNCSTTWVVIGGGSLDAAIHKAAGPDLMTECRAIMQSRRVVAVGECVMTSAGKLPCKHVIHTVCPVYMGGSWEEAAHLASCYRSALEAADNAALESIAFPCLGTGAHCYPKEEAARIALQTVQSAFKKAAHLKRAVFVCLEDENYRIYRQLLADGCLPEKSIS